MEELKDIIDELVNLLDCGKIYSAKECLSNLNEADIAIGENSIDSLNTAIRALEKIENIDNVYEKISSDLKSIYYELQEISRDISSYLEDVEFDEKEREEIESAGYF